MNMILLFSFLLSSVDHYGLSWFLSITIIVKRGQPVARLSFNHFDCAGIAIVARMVFVGKWLVAVWSRARETIVTHTPRCRLQTKGSMHFAAVSQAISIWWLCITMTRPATTDDCCPSTDAVAMWAAGEGVQGGGVRNATQTRGLYVTQTQTDVRISLGLPTGIVVSGIGHWICTENRIHDKYAHMPWRWPWTQWFCRKLAQISTRVCIIPDPEALRSWSDLHCRWLREFRQVQQQLR